jgi:hypothetical protein
MMPPDATEVVAVRKGDRVMGEARTVWHDLQTRRSAAASRHRTGLLLMAGLLIAMCTAEALFLNYVAGPDTVNLLTAAEGMPVGVE